jgi:hypothetical protein
MVKGFGSGVTVSSNIEPRSTSAPITVPSGLVHSIVIRITRKRFPLCAQNISSDAHAHTHVVADHDDRFISPAFPHELLGHQSSDQRENIGVGENLNQPAAGFVFLDEMLGFPLPPLVRRSDPALQSKPSVQRAADHSSRYHSMTASPIAHAAPCARRRRATSPSRRRDSGDRARARRSRRP